MDSGETIGFWAGYFLWRDPLIASVVIGAACGFVGVYVVLKRVIFMAAALGQVASVGVAVVFLVIHAFGLSGADHAEGPEASPILAALLFVVVVAVLLSLRPDVKRITQESIIGFAYLVAAGLVILVGDLIPQGSHDISDILFGSTVAVPFTQMVIVVVTAVLLIGAHLALHKELLFVSFDPDMARTLGLPTGLLNTALFVSIGVLIAVASRAIGALPVFAFMVLPPVGALLLAGRMNTSFAVATLFGVVAALGGYYVSWIWRTPTGATMVVLAALTLLPGVIVQAVSRFR